MIETLAAIVGAILVVGVASGFAALGMIGNLLYICEPNEVLVFSGRGERGYRVIKGGRSFRVPLLERVDRLDMTNMIIDVSVGGAYSKGGIPLNVQGVANVKIAGRDQALDNAVERLLSKSREDVMKIAKDVLEGNLRGVLAGLTPEEVNEDKIAFAEKLLDSAEVDLERLGLVLDTMKIQNVSDDRGYLNSIGRKKSADIIKSSRIAEARAKAAALTRDAANRQRARLKEIDSEEAILQAESERRVANAKTRSKALVAEESGRVGAEIARAEGGVEAEEQRVEQSRRRLEADVIEPARAEMEAGIAAAKGRSAKILEQGKASVQVLEEMIAVWQQAGPNARDIFLMQKLQVIVAAMSSTISEVKVSRITYLPADGEGSRGRDAVRLVEELKGALGVDLPKMLAQVTERK